MEHQKQVVAGWFEIPVHDMERAITFYEAVFDTRLQRHTIDNFEMAWFPWNEDARGAGGTLAKSGDQYTPSHEGVLIYFSSEELSRELNRVEAAGGRVLQPKTEITPEIGYMALFEDTEGNRLALHSKS